MAKTIFEEMGGTNAICKSIKEQPILLCSQADYLADIKRYVSSDGKTNGRA